MCFLKMFGDSCLNVLLHTVDYIITKLLPYQINTIKFLLHIYFLQIYTLSNLHTIQKILYYTNER